MVSPLGIHETEELIYLFKYIAHFTAAFCSVIMTVNTDDGKFFASLSTDDVLVST